MSRGKRLSTMEEPPLQPAPEPEYSRIRQTAYVPQEHATEKQVEAVPRSELVKGYEYAKDRYVVLEREDLKRITPATSTEMQILEFVRWEDVDPVYLETSYYLVPDEAGRKAYALLFEAMRETRAAALSEVAMHRREHIVILRPGEHGIITHTMFYPDEIRNDLDYQADVSTVNRKELELALTLIKTLETPFEPAKYRDKFREQVEAMIAAKLDGKQVVQAPAAGRPSEAMNILDALQKSLAQARKPAGRQAKTAQAKKRTGDR
jgi:DNA end-binding protein Ku